jgi:adenosine deaminase
MSNADYIVKKKQNVFIVRIAILCHYVIFHDDDTKLGTNNSTKSKSLVTGKYPTKMTTNQRELSTLPKAELHLHLEGAMRRTTLVELCNKYEIPIPIDTAGRRFEDFSGFVDVYIAACECIREVSDIKRLFQEVAEDTKFAGAVWLEIAPSFTFYSHKFGGHFECLRLLAEAAEEAEQATGVGIGLVVSVERHLGVEEAEKLAHIAKRGAESIKICGRPAICGFGLHGPEEGNSPSQFKGAFEIACCKSTMVSLPHAGEIAPYPGGGAKSVIDAVQILKAKRIGHGVLAYNNEDAMQILIDSNVCLDVGVSSNYLLNVVPTLESHPLVKLLERGIPCTINSDDPLLFGCSLLFEYEICRKDLKMDDNMLAKCAKYSFEYSCAPEEIKTKNIAEIDRWLSLSVESSSP